MNFFYSFALNCFPMYYVGSEVVATPVVWNNLENNLKLLLLTVIYFILTVD